MRRQATASKRLDELYRRLAQTSRVRQRLLAPGHEPRALMRLHVELLPPRIMMSVTAVGSETLVNTTTADHEQTPAIAMNASGNYVVVWSSDAAGGSVDGQRFNAGGAPVGAQFQINQVGAGNDSRPDVSIDAAGDFVVSWNSGGSSVYVRPYNSAGAAITAPTLVDNQRQGNAQSVVAMTGSGQFTVAWESNNSTDDDGIVAQQFDASGLANAAAFQVNSTTAGSQTNPSIASDAAGDIVIAWTDKSVSPSAIKAIYLPAGGTEIPEFTVAAMANDALDRSAAGLSAAGDFTVAWQASVGGTFKLDIYKRSFYPSTAPIDASPVLVNTYVTDNQQNPEIAERADGSYLIAWQSVNQDGNGQGVYAQAFTSAGATDGGEFLVNTTTNGNQQNPADAWSGNTAVIVWDGEGASDDQGIFQQSYSTSGAANITPVNTVPAGQSTVQDTPLTFSSSNSNVISVADSDSGGGIEQIALSATNGTISLAQTAGLTFISGRGSNDPSMTVQGTLANLNAGLDGLVFTPAASFIGAASLQIVCNDLGNSGGGGPLSATSTVNITVQSPPTSNTVPGAQTVHANAALIFSPHTRNAIVIGSGWNYAQLSAAAGTFTLANTNGLSFGNGTANGQSTIDFGGSVAAMNAALSRLVFTPTANFTGSDPISFVTSNGGLLGLGILASSQTFSIPVSVVTPAVVNQPPTITLPAALSVAENGALALSAASAISVGDPDGQSGIEEVTLVSTGGAIVLGSTAGITVAPSTGAGNDLIDFTGTLAALNNALATLTYTPDANSFGSGGIQVTINDLGNTGTGGALQATADLSITITEVNQAPTLTIPALQTTAENSTITFSTANGDPIYLADTDANGASEQVALSVANGTLSLATTTGLTFAPGSSNGQLSMTFSGTLADMNAALNGLVFTPTAGFDGADALSVTINDNGNTGSGGALQASASVPLNVFHVNQAPAVTAPAAQTTAAGIPILFSGASANLITVSDPDGASAIEQLSLTATDGLLSFGSTTGITFTSGFGNGDAADTFTGTLANLNGALASLRFTPNAGFTGSAALAATISDLGNSGVGGPLAASASIPITVLRQFAVTTTSDVTDGNTSSIAALLTDPGADGKISLREAILAANNTPGDVQIAFDLPGAGVKKITVASPLPQILAPVTIDGTTQNGYSGTPIVELDGRSAGAGAIGLAIATSHVTVRGLAIFGFRGNGVDVLPVNANHITIQGNYVGINSAGTPFFNGDGVVLANSSDDVVGGTNTRDRNVISGNYYEGVHVFGPASQRDVIIGNYIGVDPTGTMAIPNGRYGIYVDGAANNTIGGAAGNLIAYNADGVVVFGSGARGNTIRGNAIFGNAALGIDLGADGPTANAGFVNALLPNNGMNAPVVTSAILSGTTLTVSGHVGSAANQSVFAGATIEIFVADPSVASAQGQRYLGTTIADQEGIFSVALAVSADLTGATLTATATDAIGDTSEFASASAVLPPGVPPPVPTPPPIPTPPIPTPPLPVPPTPAPPSVKPDGPIVLQGPVPAANPTATPEGNLQNASPAPASGDSLSIAAAGAAPGEPQSVSLASATLTASTTSAPPAPGDRARVTGIVTPLLLNASVVHVVDVPLERAAAALSPERSGAAPVARIAGAWDLTEAVVEPRALAMLLTPGTAAAKGDVKLYLLQNYRSPYSRGNIDAAAVFSSSPLWRDLDRMQEQLAAEHHLRVVAGSATIVSVGVSVIYFFWAVRAGSILSSLISSMPAWRLVDPLPILDQMAASPERDDADEEDETLQSMVRE